MQTNIDAKTSLDNPEAFGRLVVLNKGDALIRLADIAEIELGPQSADSSSVFDGLKAVFIGVYATPTANPLTVITNVRKAFPEVQRELPAGLEATIAYDATNFIRASLWEVMKTLGEAALIVVVVIFLFLGNLRSTLIPIVTIPLSLVGVLGLLLALGYSINLMTLLALVLAIGLVVDDAIVVVENIYRHIEEGKKPMEAALMGAREIVYPIIAMTITLAAVFAPIGFVSGLTGALFKEFAFTLAGAVLVSGVIALTLSPMMCSRLLKPHNGGGGGRFTAFLDRLFEGLKGAAALGAGRVNVQGWGEALINPPLLESIRRVLGIYRDVTARIVRRAQAVGRGRQQRRVEQAAFVVVAAGMQVRWIQAVRQRRQGQRDGRAQAGLQHPADPAADPGVAAAVVGRQGRADAPQPAGLEIDDPRRERDVVEEDDLGHDGLQ